MNAKAALCRYLLSGKKINVKTCFSIIGYTNCAREVSRMVEKPFRVRLQRDHKTGKSRYDEEITLTWVDYSLPRTEENAEGIKLMTEYVIKHGGAEPIGFKTDNERRDANRKISPVKRVQETSLFDN